MPIKVKYDPVVMEKMEKDSGVRWGEVQAAMARINIGEDPPPLERKVRSVLPGAIRSY